MHMMKMYDDEMDERGGMMDFRIFRRKAGDWVGMAEIVGFIVIIIFLVIIFVIVKQRGGNILGG